MVAGADDYKDSLDVDVLRFSAAEDFVFNEVGKVINRLLCNCLSIKNGQTSQINNAQRIIRLIDLIVDIPCDFMVDHKNAIFILLVVNLLVKRTLLLELHVQLLYLFTSDLLVLVNHVSLLGQQLFSVEDTFHLSVS